MTRGYAASTQMPKPGLPQQGRHARPRPPRAKPLTPTVTTPLGQTWCWLTLCRNAEPIYNGRCGDPGRRARSGAPCIPPGLLFGTETTNAHNLKRRMIRLIETTSIVIISPSQASAGSRRRACNWLSALGSAAFYRENQGIIIGFNPSSRLPITD